MKRTIKTLLLLVTTASLVACGGSDNNETTTPKVTDYITLSGGASAELTEGEFVSVYTDIEYSGTKKISASHTIDIEGVNVTGELTDGRYTVTLDAPDFQGQLAHPATLSVTVTDGTISKQQQISLTVNNTSLRQLLDESETVADALAQADIESEIETVAAYLGDKAYLTGTLSDGERKQWQAQITPKLADLNQAVFGERKSLLDELQVEQDTLTEPQAIERFQAALAELDTPTVVLTELSETLANSNIAPFTASNMLTIAAFNGSYSVFYGNASFGEWVDNEWQFSTDAAVLEKLLPKDGQPCRTNPNTNTTYAVVK